MMWLFSEHIKTQGLVSIVFYNCPKLGYLCLSRKQLGVTMKQTWWMIVYKNYKFDKDGKYHVGKLQ